MDHPKTFIFRILELVPLEVKMLWIFNLHNIPITEDLKDFYKVYFDIREELSRVGTIGEKVSVYLIRSCRALDRVFKERFCCMYNRRI